MPARRVKILLADDHEIVRHGVREILDAQEGLRVVGEAATAAAALEAVRRLRPDLVVLDVQFPDGSGVEVCRDIRSDHPEINVLMLTAFADEQAYVAAVMAGASGYLLKRIQTAELVDAVRRAAAGESLLDDEFARRMLARAASEAHGDPLLDRLSPQELKVLDLIARGHTNREIADDIFLAEKTVKNYVSNLLSKLEMSNRSEAAAYAARLAAMRGGIGEGEGS
jgi:DNA-binding NarL/FixJ family response regulator